MQVLDGLISEYETSCHGPGKWQKLATFLQQRFAPAFSSSFQFVICFMFLNYKTLQFGRSNSRPCQEAYRSNWIREKFSHVEVPFN